MRINFHTGTMVAGLTYVQARRKQNLVLKSFAMGIDIHFDNHFNACFWKELYQKIPSLSSQVRHTRFHTKSNQHMLNKTLHSF